MNSFTITLPLPSPSLNDWKGRHWRAYYSLKTKWLKMMMVEIDVLPEKPFERAKITVHRYGVRRLDSIDNFTGGLKPVIDNLKKLGFIVDDTPSRLIGGDHQQFIDRENPRTEIFLEELPEEEKKSPKKKNRKNQSGENTSHRNPEGARRKILPSPE